MFGVYGQGSTPKGYKSVNQTNCGVRTMMLAVTSATNMTSSQVILLEAGSYTFYDSSLSEMSSSVALKAGSIIALASSLFLY
jgi:hypothetical protein